MLGWGRQNDSLPESPLFPLGLLLGLVFGEKLRAAACPSKTAPWTSDAASWYGRVHTPLWPPLRPLPWGVG